MALGLIILFGQICISGFSCFMCPILGIELLVCSQTIQSPVELGVMVEILMAILIRMVANVNVFQIKIIKLKFKAINCVFCCCALHETKI